VNDLFIDLLICWSIYRSHRDDFAQWASVLCCVVVFQVMKVWSIIALSLTSAQRRNLLIGRWI